MRFALAALVVLVSSVSTAAVIQPLCGADSSQKTDGKQAPSTYDEPQKIGTRVTCPVSGEQFTITSATAHSEYKGKHVYFCCPSCKGQFDKNPEKYMGKVS
jgi:YHS domain-containing protein